MTANKAALAFSVSNTVSIMRRSTPPSSRPRVCSLYAVTSSSNVILRKLGSFTFGDIEQVRLVGPSMPATNRGLSGCLAVKSSAAARANLADCKLISYTSLSTP